MRIFRAAFLVLLCLGVATGCTTNHSPGDVKFTTQAAAELAVGTLNDPTNQFGTAGVSLNVVTSFRNQFGNSAFINPGDATLTLPAGGGTVALATFSATGKATTA